MSYPPAGHALYDAGDVTLARAIAAEAAGLLMTLRGGALNGAALGDAGDREANALILAMLRRERPSDAILSEESEDDPCRLAARRVWIIDPLDGTREYSEGRDDFAVHIGLAIDGAAALGAVALPARGEIYDSGHPPALQPMQTPPRLIVSRTRCPDCAVEMAGVLGAQLLPMGSAGAKAMAVLRGEAEIYLHAGGQHEWDNCAPAAVALAAGLHVSRLDGSPIRYDCADTRVPDLLICRREWAERVLAAYRLAQAASGIRHGQPHIRPMTRYSLLDLVPITEGGSVAQSLANAADLARHCEAVGFTRYWVAEHHGMAGIASAATSLVIGHVAAATRHIRVGAGGIMLPNHAPLVIAEQFGTLDALFPGRIDLGLGRAPGSDQKVAAALRRTLDSDPNLFPRDVIELQGYFADDGQTGIRATPGAGADVQLYILGSSLYGAQVAAALGLPYAFASHFAPQMLDEALHVYRSHFRPSAACAEPYAMAGFNIIAADTDAEATLLASSMQQSFVRLRTGNPGQLPPPVKDYRESLGPRENAILDGVLSASAIGGAATVKAAVDAFIARTQVDELIVTASIFDHEARKHSLALTAALFAPD